MGNRAAMYFGTAALIAQIFVAQGCSSSTGTTPVTTGSGGAGGSTTGAGGTTTTGTGGSTFTGPVGLQCDASVKNKGACTTEPACFNTCGPLKSGIKNCTCSGGTWMCPTCAFDPAGNYACYKITATTAACPTDSTDPVNGLPKSGDPCNGPLCAPCGSGTANAYRDSTNTPKIGWCVCSADDGTGTYSCASTAEWAPQN